MADDISTQSSTQSSHIMAFKLDESLYNLTEDERTFFKQQTGIPDDDELKSHICQLQAEAYEVHAYPCIRFFTFAKFRTRLFQSTYQDLLKRGKSRKGAIFLDIGSCMGTDARKLIADGYPLEQVVTSDLSQGGRFSYPLVIDREFANLGHKLFKTTEETYPIAFVPGDIFDPNLLEIAQPVASAHASTEGPAPDLRSLTSLNPLRGRVFAIHASCFFHLFSEEKQLHVARALAGLLSPEPGSMIIGMHVGLPVEKGFESSMMHGNHRMWCHSPDSWTQLWDGVVFEKGVVNVKTKLVTMEKKDTERNGLQNTTLTILYWWVTRL